MAGVEDLADGAEVLVLVGAEASADGAEDLEDGPEDSVAGAEDLADGDLTHSGIHFGTHSGAEASVDGVDSVVGAEASVDGVDSVVGAEASVAGVDGILTLLDTGTHTDPFIMVVV